MFSKAPAIVKLWNWQDYNFQSVYQKRSPKARLPGRWLACFVTFWETALILLKRWITQRFDKSLDASKLTQFCSSEFKTQNMNLRTVVPHNLGLIWATEVVKKKYTLQVTTSYSSIASYQCVEWDKDEKGSETNVCSLAVKKKKYGSA